MYHPPYLYFLWNKTTTRILDQNGDHYRLNYRWINTDSLYLLRLHEASLRIDTVAFLRHPVTFPYKTLFEESGVFNYNPETQVVQWLQNHDTITTYRIENPRPLLQKPDPAPENLPTTLRHHLFLHPNDSVYRLDRFTPSTAGNAAQVRFFWQQNASAIAQDTLLLPTPDFFRDTLYYTTAVNLLKQKNKLYLTASGLNGRDTNVRAHLFCYRANDGALLWHRTFFKDSAYSVIRDIHFSPQGDLWLSATVYGSKRWDWYFSNHRPVMVKMAQKEQAQLSKNEVNLWPNPAQTEVHVHSSRSWKWGRLLNINGQEVLEFEYRKNTVHRLSIDHLPTGMYTLLLQSQAGEQAVRKVIVQ